MHNKVRTMVWVSFMANVAGSTEMYYGTIVIPMRRARVTKTTMDRWADYIAGQSPLPLTGKMAFLNWGYM